MFSGKNNNPKVTFSIFIDQELHLFGTLNSSFYFLSSLVHPYGITTQKISKTVKFSFSHIKYIGLLNY